MADPTVIECTTACTITVQHEITLPVLSLTLEDGAAISSAILLVWAVGFGFRALVQTLKTTDGNHNSED